MRCGFGTLSGSKGVVDLCGGIGKVEQRRARRNVCLLHRRQRRIGDRSSGDEEGAGDGADAGSGTFICGRGDAWEEIWAIRESTVSS